MNVKTHIFREYDIRGIVDKDLAGNTSELIGKAFGSEVKKRLGGTPTLAVGHDNRPSSPGLADGIIKGITAAGVNVLFVGTVPTPVLYYATEKLKTDGGLQITGSHNPPEYNGFKMVVKGRAIYGDAIQGLLRRIQSDDFERGNGTVTKREINQEYIEDIGSRFQPKRKLKVVVDCGNGTGSLVAVPLLERAGAQVIPLYCESDGT
jgi:phosphomannomutase/phosphoglucomutase